MLQKSCFNCGNLIRSVSRHGHTEARCRLLVQLKDENDCGENCNHHTWDDMHWMMLQGETDE
jgi:hypothetical protein